jgi:hypothetical protein
MGIIWQSIVVDFRQISSYPSSELEFFLRNKALQMGDRERVKFKIKLAAYLARLTQEEESAGFENPWA